MIELKKHPENPNSYYWIIYYCYDNKCPARTKEQPYPSSDGEYKYVTVIIKKGKPYKRKQVVCKHCGKIMQGTIDANIFA
jgi:hypothetical protein